MDAWQPATTPTEAPTERRLSGREERAGGAAVEVVAEGALESSPGDLALISDLGHISLDSSSGTVAEEMPNVASPSVSGFHSYPTPSQT